MTRTKLAEIQWDGSFTMVYYGGMTYWSINDPKLVVEDGEGTITGTMSGYGADMNDLSKWVELEDRPNATVADLTDVNVTDSGIEVTPEVPGRRDRRGAQRLRYRRIRKGPVGLVPAGLGRFQCRDRARWPIGTPPADRSM